mmetsp:Transcript_9563/g.19810  ORF Transcript_9563/g.19810 Transcript_9563/m.19810 type:complete len:142 (+) Transcript_9563:101-526(+)|eukprot:CAMPEP_0118921124 /NCGR_PEP_ID=MMETSP1169-20130426/504_1 /TAXON_ID=36882 /ORGANISM="Pyramimonas obovata, Strain CCMP722" /LENGTH=141 /DNA_ID=CAMNT_0006861793 /DNA_START=77 /DNA_END=502 /DNA_ORIENTATION=-
MFSGLIRSHLHEGACAAIRATQVFGTGASATTPGIREGLPSLLQFERWASKKQGGSTSNGRDSAGRRLGVKKFAGEHVIPGNILVRQRGTKFHPGDNILMGKDHTLHATIDGYARFYTDRETKRRYISVEPTRELAIVKGK